LREDPDNPAIFGRLEFVVLSVTAVGMVWLTLLARFLDMSAPFLPPDTEMKG
jgi:hypothetical protein